ncbi:hypothetical protein [Sphingomonas sp.]|uniref:hypothetical protein n=1 Tax=Sphingomonas sp. TaxID=28214 RepID=UPI0035BC50C4
MANATGPREPLARALARAVVEELSAFLAEDDPVLVAFGEFQRRTMPTPARALATDPDIDTLALFVDERVARLRARAGRANSSGADDVERRAILNEVERRLTGRYLRHLRAV